MSSDQIQRPKFYEGQYLSASDLTTAVDYGRTQAARHALGAHTWGIAAGLDLRALETPIQGRVDMILDPGYAWDGFGRPIIVTAPFKLPPELFKSITYKASLDGSGKGRLVEVWLRYCEISTCKPAAGFQVCDIADQSMRIQETYQITVGPKKNHTDCHDQVTVAGKSSDAQTARQLFDTQGPEIYDESIPYQTFPEPEEKAQWLIPIGYVRWRAVQNGVGNFLALTDEDLVSSRAFRRYIGVVTENIEAADGAIRLRDRTKDPAASKYCASAEELVNIEGHLRVEGDVRLANGKLDFRASNGTDMETPLKLQRSGDIDQSGDEVTSVGGRELQLVLGPDSQADNRFSIGPLKPTADGHTFDFDAKVTVVSDGKIGIGTTSPDQLLTLQDSDNASLNLKNFDAESNAVTSELLLGASSDGGVISVITNQDLQLRTGEDDTKMVIKADGKVGIGTTSPNRALTLQGNGSTYLNVKANGGTYELLLGADSHGGVVSTMTNHDLQLRAGNNDTKMIVKADGKIGIGTKTPEQELHVIGGRIRLESNGKTIDLRTDGSAVDLQSETSNLYLRGHNHVIMNPYSGEGSVGIGTQSPSQKLHVVGDRIRLENGGKIIELRTDGEAVDLQSETSKLYLRGHDQVILNPFSGDGGVGIGTENPSCKLHVANAIAGNANYINSHVAVIENTSTDSGGDVLALKVHANPPDTSNNFITFFGGDTALGSIEYDGEEALMSDARGVYLNSSSADYAEQLPHLDNEESFEAGEIVGILEGKVTHQTGAAQVVSAITDRPVVVANSPRRGDPRKFEKVTFIGQLPVKVQGPVHAGDYIVPSGKDDGIGMAVSPGKLSLEQAGKIVGQAWETSEEAGPRRVLTAIGLPTANGIHLTAILQTLSQQIDALQAEVKRLREA